MTSSQQEKFIKWLELNMQKLSRNLKLSTLDKILISNNVTKDVISVQRRYNIKESECLVNKNELVRVLCTKIRDVLKQVIVISDNIIMGLFHDELVQESFHILHKELCRVHDNYNREYISNVKEIKNERINKLQQLLYSYGQEVWSEYVSTRLSAMSVDFRKENLLDNLYFSSFNKLISSYNEKKEEYILTYRADGRKDCLFKSFQEETLLLFKSSAIVQGYMDGLKVSEDEKMFNLLNELISKTYFYHVWEEQWKQLQYLFNIYPYWDDIYQLSILGRNINSFCDSQGIYLIYNEEIEQISIEVP